MQGTTKIVSRTYPDEEDGRAEVACISVDHVGGNDSDDGVPQPVGGRRETDTTGTDREGEDLACVCKSGMSHRPGEYARKQDSPMTTQAPGPHVEAKKKM